MRVHRLWLLGLMIWMVAGTWAQTPVAQLCDLPYLNLQPKAKYLGARLISWQANGGLIPVYFLNGTPAQRLAVEHYAREWERYGNFRFEFHQEPKTDASLVAIMVEFSVDGPPQILGTSSLGTGIQGTTQRSLWLRAADDIPSCQTIQHEFGHALGLAHEQDSNAFADDWIPEQAYRYFGDLGRDRQWVDLNILTATPAAQLHVRGDKSSVMAYSLPGDYFKSRQGLTPAQSLTREDAQGIALMYPGKNAPYQETAVLLPADTSWGVAVTQWGGSEGQVRFSIDGSTPEVEPLVNQRESDGKTYRQWFFPLNIAERDRRQRLRVELLTEGVLSDAQISMAVAPLGGGTKLLSAEFSGADLNSHSAVWEPLVVTQSGANRGQPDYYSDPQTVAYQPTAAAHSEASWNEALQNMQRILSETPPKAAFDAATLWGQDKLLLFKDAGFVFYDTAQALLLPKTYDAIRGNSWPGLDFDGIDAVLATAHNKAYFFRGHQYVRYDMVADRADPSYPKPINSSTWPGLPFTQIDAVYSLDGQSAIFFHGDSYVRYDLDADRAVSPPHQIKTGFWLGLPFDQIDEAVVMEDKVYFFKDKQYAVYNPQTGRVEDGFPRLIAEGLPGLKPLLNY